MRTALGANARGLGGRKPSTFSSTREGKNSHDSRKESGYLVETSTGSANSMDRFAPDLKRKRSRQAPATRPALHFFAALLIASAQLGCGSIQPSNPPRSGGSDTRSPYAKDLGPFVPTPIPVVRKMLEVARVTSADIVYDLGCGDGRIVVEAAKLFGARAVGIDYDAARCREARERAEREGVSHLVEIRHEDVLEADFSEATVVTLYLLPTSNAKLKPKLQALRPGTRIVSHDYGIEGWEPLTTVLVETADFQEHRILLWEVGAGARQ